MKKTTDRKSDIVKAARNLFQTKDYEKTTMQDIMDSVGIAKGTIYHHFKSKEAILEAVIETIVDESIDKMKTILSESSGNALEKFKLLIHAGNSTNDNKKILDHIHKSGNDSMHTRLLAVAIKKQAVLYGEVIQQGCKEGVFNTTTPLESAEFILSACQFLTDIGIYPWEQTDIHRRIQAFPRIIEQQLQSPVGSFQFLIESLED